MLTSSVKSDLKEIKVNLQSINIEDFVIKKKEKEGAEIIIQSTAY